MYDGYLVMPWSPEWGGGGISFYDMSDACQPDLVGEATQPTLRETHAIGFALIAEGEAYDGDWMATNMMGGLAGSGIQFWNISDPANPTHQVDLVLPDVFYPDSYGRVSLSLFWQYPYVYVAAADVGVYVVDAKDPTAPVVLSHYAFDQGFRAGGVFAMGDVLLVTSAEQSEAALLDISDPSAPSLFPGGRFATLDGEGEPRESYHGNLAGHYAMFARKESGGGIIVYDISDPTQPTFLTDYYLPGRSGGYAFYDEGFFFVGGSSQADVIDARTFDNPSLYGEAFLEGDLDTVTPYGNVMILSVDDEADEVASVVVPWREAPDGNAPLVLGTQPLDGATGVPLTGKIGVGFNEMIEPTSFFLGGVRLWDSEGNAVRGYTSAQENTANYVPLDPLKPGTTYTFEVLADTVTDVNGNAIDETYTFTFTTVQ